MFLRVSSAREILVEPFYIKLQKWQEVKITVRYIIKIIPKSVDIYSCGIIMYFIYSKGQHPIWDRLNDTKSMFVEKLCGDYKFKILEAMTP